MGDFSIKALTAPFVQPVQRYFDKTTNFITSKNRDLAPDKVDHDVKVLMFNAATVLIANTISIAYFRKIALVTAVALVALFYLVRRVIDETPKRPPSETSTTLNEVVAKGWSLVSKRTVQIPIVSQRKPLKERFQEFFRQDDAIVIGNVVLLKLTHYPMPTVIGMFLTRRP
jgi:hypothetical protein